MFANKVPHEDITLFLSFKKNILVLTLIKQVLKEDCFSFFLKMFLVVKCSVIVINFVLFLMLSNTPICLLSIKV